MMLMKKIISTLIISVVAVIFLASCETTKLTRGEQYTKLYDEKPTTILVMPPINNTTEVEAKDLLYTSINYPLVEAGYYVISPHLAMEMLKSESAYDAELFIDGDMSMFGKVFGADAVVFSVIDKWKKVGFGIETDITYIVKSTKTNEVLFEHKCNLYLDLSVDNNSNTLLGSLVSLAASAVSTLATDHIVAARLCNRKIFSDLPYGKYNPNYQKDKSSPANVKEFSAKVKR